jgi:hypothetical protein
VLLYRFLKKCQGYVRTKSHPKGSIMEGFLFDEALTLCSRYLQDETHYNHRVRNHDRVQKEISPITPFLDSIGQALAGNVLSIYITRLGFKHIDMSFSTILV